MTGRSKCLGPQTTAFGSVLRLELPWWWISCAFLLRSRQCFGFLWASVFLLDLCLPISAPLPFFFLFHKSRTDVMPMVRWMPVTSLVMAHACCVSLWSPYVSLKWHKSGDFRIGTHSMMVTKPTTLECISVSRKHWATQRQMQSHVNTGLRSVAKVRCCLLACLLHCQQQKQWRNAGLPLCVALRSSQRSGCRINKAKTERRLCTLESWYATKKEQRYTD